MKGPSILTSLTASLLAASLLSSCGNQDASSDKVVNKQGTDYSNKDYKPFSQRLNEKNGFTTDENGNWKAINNKRSQLDYKGEATTFSKKTDKKEYKTGEFTKKSWWGKKEYNANQFAQANQSFSGDNKTFQTGPSSYAAKSSASSHKAYQTSQFATKSANEASHSSFARKPNSSAANAQHKEIEPTIIDWKEQRTMSIKQSRDLLGR